MIKRLKFIGRDGWARPVYRDENGKLWKDPDCRAGWQGALYSSVGNDFEGEPDWPMEPDTPCEFYPKRITD